MLVEAPQGRSEALRVLRDAMALYEQEKERLQGRVPEDGVGRSVRARRARAAAAPRSARRGRRHGRGAGHGRTRP